MAFGDLLRKSAGDNLNEKALDSLDRMQNAAGRMKTLINGLLKLSRVTTQGEQFQPVNLKLVAEEAVNDLEIRIKESGGLVELDELTTVMADRLQMYHLFQNIISNSLKFHKKGQPPTIKIECNDRQNDFVEIYIKDNGIGFDEKFLDRIFKPFQRLNTRSEYEGTGIGLAICNKIVQRHNGRITAKSEPQKGVTFIISLPKEAVQKGEDE